MALISELNIMGQMRTQSDRLLRSKMRLNSSMVSLIARISAMYVRLCNNSATCRFCNTHACKNQPLTQYHCNRLKFYLLLEHGRPHFRHFDRGHSLWPNMALHGSTWGYNMQSVPWSCYMKSFSGLNWGSPPSGPLRAYHAGVTKKSF